MFTGEAYNVLEMFDGGASSPCPMVAALADITLEPDDDVEEDDILNHLSSAELFNDMMFTIPEGTNNYQIEAPTTSPRRTFKSIPYPDNTTSSELSSPESSSEVFTPYATITVAHKPRGSGGKWIPIGKGEGIRITKGIGKRIKLTIRCNFEFSWEGMKLELFNERGVVLEGFNIRNKYLDNRNTATLEVTIKEKHDKIYFTCNIWCMNDETTHCVAKSVCFGGHDSGKYKLQREKNFQKTVVEDKIEKSSLPPPLSSSSLSSKTHHSPISNIVEEEPSTTKKRKQQSISSTGIESLPITTTHMVDGNLEVHGSVRAKAYLQFSDMRLKTDVEDLMGALDLIMQIKGKSYVWKSDKKIAEKKEEEKREKERKDKDNEDNNCDDDIYTPQRVIGLIAQEVQRVVPEVVTCDPETGLLAVSYSELVPVLIEGLKEHIIAYRQDKTEIEEQLTSIREDIEVLMNTRELQKEKSIDIINETKDEPSSPLSSLSSSSPHPSSSSSFSSSSSSSSSLSLSFYQKNEKQKKDLSKLQEARLKQNIESFYSRVMETSLISKNFTFIRKVFKEVEVKHKWEEIKWEDSVDTALKRCTNEKKPLLLELTSNPIKKPDKKLLAKVNEFGPWRRRIKLRANLEYDYSCPTVNFYGRLLRSTVLSDPKMIERINSEFVPLQIDIAQGLPVSKISALKGIHRLLSRPAKPLFGLYSAILIVDGVEFKHVLNGYSALSSDFKKHLTSNKFNNFIAKGLQFWYDYLTIINLFNKGQRWRGMKAMASWVATLTKRGVTSTCQTVVDGRQLHKQCTDAGITEEIFSAITSIGLQEGYMAFSGIFSDSYDEKT